MEYQATAFLKYYREQHIQIDHTKSHHTNLEWFSTCGQITI